MTDFDPDVPLNRIKGESQKAHDALIDYFLMGSGRSLEKLRQKYAETTLNKPPTIHLRTLQIWSSPRRYSWSARITRQTEIDNEIALEQYRQRHMSEAEIMARLADMARADMADFADVRRSEDLKEIKQSPLVKKFTITERKSRDDTEIVKTTIELHNAQRALELLGKDFGRFKNRLDITTGDQPFTIDDLTQATQELTNWEDENNPDSDPET